MERIPGVVAAIPRSVAREPGAGGSWMKSTGSRTKHRTQGAVRAVDAAYLEHEQGRTDAGLRILDACLSLEPSNPWVAATAGNLLRMAGRYREAIGRFDLAIAQQPNAAYTLALRGDCHSQLGRPRTALADYERALHLGISDQQRRCELCHAAAEIYEFLHDETASPLFSAKAGLYREMALQGSIDPRVQEEVSKWRRSLSGAIWLPCRSYAALGFGSGFERVLLRVVRLRLGPDEAWVPFDESLGLTFYTDQGVLQMVKATHSVNLHGQEVMAMEPGDLRRLLGAPDSSGEEDGDAYMEYPDRCATFFFAEGKVAEAMLSGASL